ncbi:MAG: general secretion pathway protein GspK [Acidobacteria bacterium]|nr:general secretion pathway protein GspK [Acidobacteriota bacterium]
MPTCSSCGRPARRGSALLIVLWLSAALSAIALSLAGSVRGEVERATNALEGTRAYYLATGAIQRALLYIDWGRIFRLPDGSSPYYVEGMPLLHLAFPTGVATVEVIPEASKLNLNYAPPEELYRLLVNLGAPPEPAGEITRAIVDWREPAPAGPTLFDQYYLSLQPSFRARHASFEEVEELLYVKGMTAELFYGSHARDAEGRLIPRPGLRDCVTVYGAPWQSDVNTTEPAVLAAIGIPLPVVAAIVETRRHMPIRSPEQLMRFAEAAGPAGQRLRVGGFTIYTLRATARPRVSAEALSDLRRSVAAVVKLNPQDIAQSYQVLRWYDHVWVEPR